MGFRASLSSFVCPPQYQTEKIKYLLYSIQGLKDICKFQGSKRKNRKMYSYFYECEILSVCVIDFTLNIDVSILNIFF